MLRTGLPNADKTVIFIHGCDLKTSNASQFTHFFEAYTYMQYKVVSIDMPGYGKSEGKAHSFRTVAILEKDGPAELIKEIIQNLNLTNVTLVGYDWGGSIALRMGVQNSNGFENIIAFMPAYGESD